MTHILYTVISVRPKEGIKHMGYDRDNVTGLLLRNDKDCRVKVHAPLPKVSYASIEKNRSLCRTNMCGHYNHSWTCPPNCGSAESCLERIDSYRDCDVIMKTFRDVDFSDTTAVDRMMNGFRDTCREVMIGCRKAGFDVMAFADGPCSYCRECAFTEGKKCRHPDMQVPSVSGYGFDMTDFLKRIGESFGFSKDTVTLYGVILFK